LKYFN